MVFDTTLSNLRSKFWIVKERKAVKSVLRRCVTYCRYQGRLLLPPKIPDLPDYRVNTLYAFQCTGLDYARPLFIKNKTDTTLKVYISLFTCASSRALHLELTPGIKALAFIRAYERFTARRGTPDIIVLRLLNHRLSRNLCCFLTVRQKFILLASPW